LTTEEDRIFAELFVDLKGPKKKRRDWMRIAGNCQKLLDKYHSSALVAEKLDVSPGLFRAIISLNKLPREVKDLVRRGDLLFDSAQRLNAIKSRQRQIEVAKLIVNMPNKRQRDVIAHAARYPDSDLKDYRDKVKNQKAEKEKLRLVIIPMREELYQSFSQKVRSIHKSLDEVFPEMVENWLKKNGGRQ
jgi:hypothetical protein